MPKRRNVEYFERTMNMHYKHQYLCSCVQKNKMLYGNRISNFCHTMMCIIVRTFVYFRLIESRGFGLCSDGFRKDNTSYKCVYLSELWFMYRSIFYLIESLLIGIGIEYKSCWRDLQVKQITSNFSKNQQQTLDTVIN